MTAGTKRQQLFSSDRSFTTDQNIQLSNLKRAPTEIITPSLYGRYDPEIKTNKILILIIEKEGKVIILNISESYFEASKIIVKIDKYCSSLAHIMSSFRLGSIIKLMKKLLGILNLPQATTCYALQTDFKSARQELKKYLKSLKQLKARTNLYQINLSYWLSALSQLAGKHNTIKKRTPLDYYTLQSNKMIRKLADEALKSTSASDMLVRKITDAQRKIEKCLEDNKKNFATYSSSHKQIVQDYAEKCYPQTTTLLYILGFIDSEKIAKKPDPNRENTVIEEAKMYAGILEQSIEEMEILKQLCIKLGEECYLGQRDNWVRSLQEILLEAQKYEIVEEELEEYYPGHNGDVSFRSARSNAEQDDKN